MPEDTLAWREGCAVLVPVMPPRLALCQAHDRLAANAMRLGPQLSDRRTSQDFPIPGLVFIPMFNYLKNKNLARIPKELHHESMKNGRQVL